MRIFTFLFILFTLSSVTAQKYKSSKYYLIDSLDFKTLDESDRILIDTSLQNFHKEKTDSAKLSIVMHIVDNCWDEIVWPKYNEWANIKVNRLLKKDQNSQQNKYLNSILAETILNKGFFYDTKGKSLAALDYYFKSLKIYEDLKDTSGIATLYTNIGYVFKKQGNEESAIKYYKKALYYFTTLDEFEGISTNLINIAVILYRQEKLGAAITYNEKALELGKKSNNRELIALSLSNLGNIYQAQGKVKLAHKNFEEALAYSRENGDKLGISSILRNLANMDLTEGNFEAAKTKLQESLRLAKEIQNTNKIMESSGLLSTVYSRLGQGELAYETLKLHMQMKDSVNNQNTKTETIKLQAQYEYESQKKIDKIAFEKRLAISKAEKEKGDIQLFWGFGLLLMAIGFLIFFINRLKVTQRQRNLIEVQKKEEQLQKEIIRETHKELTDSLRYSKRLLKAMLPSKNLALELSSDLFMVFLPKHVISGDFFFSAEKGNTRYIAVADCTGHGVPGAMVSMVCSYALSRSMTEFDMKTPAEILNKTREIIINAFSSSLEPINDGMDISLCAFEGNKLTFAGANNGLWLVKKDGNSSKLIEYKGDKQPIGLYRNLHDFTNHEIKIQPGDNLYMFSDGYADQFGGEKQKKFKLQAFRKLILEIQDQPMTDQKNALTSSLKAWQGDLEQVDDITVFGMTVK